MNSDNRAVFLDRDGVLIKDVNYLSRLEDISIYDDVPEGLISLKKNGFKLIMITNQSGVARGFFDESFVYETYNFLNNIFSKSGVSLDDLYFCPHHQQGKPPYNIKCDCRKPAPGMIEKASKKHGIDCQRSFMLGDKKSDVELAYNSGTRGILLRTGKGDSEAASVAELYPEVPILDTFSDAIDFILKNSFD